MGVLFVGILLAVVSEMRKSSLLRWCAIGIMAISLGIIAYLGFVQ